MTNLLGIAGSLRAKSYNAGLLRAAAKLEIPDTTIEIGSIADIPLYNGDVEENEGIPESVQLLKSRLKQSDGLLLVTPEYNNSIPGVFKNVIDWLSRPAADIKATFGDRPVAVIGASPGGFGTILSQQAWLQVLRTLGTRPWFGGRLQVSHAGQAFDAQGELIDAKIRGQLDEFIRGFSAFAAKQQ